MKYFIMLYESKSINDGAILETYSNLPFPDYMFDKCVSLEEKIFGNIILEMDKDDPDSRVLYDMVDNIDQLPVVSEQFKEMLQHCDCGNVEFLPISIKNHRDKIEKEKYYIVNLIDSIDYIDKEKTTIKYSHMNESQIRTVKNLCLKLENIPENRDLFRADYYYNRYVVSEDLKNKIDDEEFEGMIFVPIEEFNSVLF